MPLLGPERGFALTFKQKKESTFITGCERLWGISSLPRQTLRGV